MSEFKKLTREELKEVKGGNLHFCTVTCNVQQQGVGGAFIPFTFTVDSCNSPLANCSGAGDFVGCGCQ